MEQEGLHSEVVDLRPREAAVALRRALVGFGNWCVRPDDFADVARHLSRQEIEALGRIATGLKEHVGEARKN